MMPVDVTVHLVLGEQHRLEGRVTFGMEQRRDLDLPLFGYAAGEMVCAEGVLESSVCGAWVDQKCMTKLPDVPQTLERGRIDDRESLGLEADVVPEWVANYLKRR